MTRLWRVKIEYLHGQVWTDTTVMTEGYSPEIAVQRAVSEGRQNLPKRARVREIKLHAVMLPGDGNE